MSTIKIALLDDHQIVLDGLKLLLSTDQRYDIILEDTHALYFLEQLKTSTPDIVLTDIMMPIKSGYEVAKHIKEHFPHIAVIALSMNGEGDLAYKLIHDIQIEGYILKTTDRNELFNCINEVYKGKTYYCAEVSEQLQLFTKTQKENEILHLTNREIEIIQCIAKNLSNKEIAEQLFISERTVETHRKNIFRKTNMHSALALVDFAKQRKII